MKMSTFHGLSDGNLLFRLSLCQSRALLPILREPTTHGRMQRSADTSQRNHRKNAKAPSATKHDARGSHGLRCLYALEKTGSLSLCTKEFANPPTAGTRY